MLRSALFLAAGIMSALLFACVATPQGSVSATGGGGGAHALRLRPANCDPSAFLSHVAYYEDLNFSPKRYGKLPVTQALPAGPDYLTALGDAYCAAPPDFQTVLSTQIDAVYINGAACNGSDCFETSWGWWRRVNPLSSAHQRLVSLSSSLWNSQYSDYETKLTQSILPPAPPIPPNPPRGITYSEAQPFDDVAAALLGALAHEIGHIRWFEWVNGNLANYCIPNFFANSWSGTVNQPPPGANGGWWRHLLTPGHRQYLRNTGRYRDTHLNPPQIDDIDSLPTGSDAQYQAIFGLLVPPPPPPPARTSPWASLFASMSPDEDFVETYKLKVLTDSTAPNPLTSVRITVPNAVGPGVDGTTNIVADLLHTPTTLRPFLKTKVDCISY